MRVLFDLNVLIDLFQRREPFYQSSARALGAVVDELIAGWVPAHALTTVHYLLARHATQQAADSAVDWILGRFEVAPTDRSVLFRARSLPISDFEDAVVASAAEATGCAHIVTRNAHDFGGSPVPALTPDELLVLLAAP